MSSKDIYNKATVYNSGEARTQAPQHNYAPSGVSSSRSRAPSSSRLSSSAQQYTMLQRDGQGSSSRVQAPAPQNYTLLNRDQSSSSSSRQPTMMRTVATAPPNVKSKFKTQHDVDMASRQVKYQQMNHAEKKKQDEWVHNFIQYAGPCPHGFTWERVKYGYVCNGGNHLCTDELLAEGKGGFYCGTLSAGWWGPIYNPIEYLNMTNDRVYMYAKKHGLDPTVAPVIPEPDLPATKEIHPGVAKALLGLGPMPAPQRNEDVYKEFEMVGVIERVLQGMDLGLPSRTPRLSTLYGPGGRPNRLAMSTSDGSSSQGGQLPSGSHRVPFGNAPYGQGPYGRGRH